MKNIETEENIVGTSEGKLPSGYFGGASWIPK